MAVERTGVRNLGALEADVMAHLWAAGASASVRQVLEALNKDAREKPLAYTTVMTVLENLHRKGFVRRQKDGRAFRYTATMSREQHTAELMDGVLARTTDRGAALLHFVERMSPDELVELREALERLAEPGNQT